MKKQKANCMNCNSLQLVKDIKYLGDEKWECPNCKNKLICPHCKEEIESVDFDVTGTCSSNLYADNAEATCYEAYDLDSLLASVQFDNFRCPNCSALIGKGNEDDARKFLKGELK